MEPARIKVVFTPATPPENIHPQSSGSNSCCNGSDAHRGDGGDPNPCHNHSQCQRDFHLPQELEVSHPHAPTRLFDRGIDPLYPRVGAADNRQQSVQDQCHDGSAGPNPSHHRDRDEKTKQGQTGDGLDHIGKAENDLFQSGLSGDQHAGRNTDHHGHRDRHQDHPQMLSG